MLRNLWPNHPPITERFSLPPRSLSGVYAIKNRYTGEEYIRQRLLQHMNALQHGRHFSKKLQADWERLGGEAFFYAHHERMPSHFDPLRYPRPPIAYLREAEARNIVGRQPAYNTNVAFMTSKYRPKHPEIWWLPDIEAVNEMAIQQRSNAEMQALRRFMSNWQEVVAEQPPASGPTAQA